MKLIVILANQLRLMYQSKQLSLQGYTQYSIASLLEIHPYRVKLALEKSRGYLETDILQFLYQLAIMDLDIKTGKVNKALALELFVLEII